jgi:hypothetical protein
MKQDELMKKLGAPFLPDEIEWRVQSAGLNDGKPWAIVVPYVQARAIQQRFDDVVGLFGWQQKFEKWHEFTDDGKIVYSQLCGIGLYCDNADLHPMQEWIWKYDGAECTKIEGIKGGLSKAFIRAAVHWGPGRDLYSLPTTFAECSLQKVHGWHYDSAKVLKGNNAKRYSFWWKTPQLPAQALPEGFQYRESAATGPNFNEPEPASPLASDQMQDDFDRLMETLKTKLQRKFEDDVKGAKKFLLEATSHLKPPVQAASKITDIETLEMVIYKLENPRATDEAKLKFQEEMETVLKGKKVTIEEWLKKNTSYRDTPLISTSAISTEKELRALKGKFRKEFGKKAQPGPDEGDRYPTESSI